MKNINGFELIPAWLKSKFSFVLTVTITLFAIPIISYTQEPNCDDECTTQCDYWSGAEIIETWGTGTISTDIYYPTPALIVVNGNITFSGSDVDIENVVFRIKPGVRFIIPSNSNVDFTTCFFYACDTMWRGIELDLKSVLTMNSCHIEDAQFAIRGYNQAQVSLTDNIFNRNDVGIYYHNSIAPAPPLYIPTPPMSINAFDGNLFTCCNVLNKPYTGQSPAPDNWSRSGMLISDGSFNFGVSATNPNNFTCMLQGAEFNHANALFENCRFHYMRSAVTTSPAAYQENTGLALLDSYLDFTGNLATSYGNTISVMDAYGIYAYNTPVDVSWTKIDEMEFGIFIDGTQNDDISITHNYFSNSNSAAIYLTQIKSTHQVLIQYNSFYDHNFSHLYVLDRDNHTNTLKVYNNTFEQNGTPCTMMIETGSAVQGNLEFLDNAFQNNTNNASMGLMHLHPNSGNFNFVEGNTYNGVSLSNSYAGLWVNGCENTYYCDNSFDDLPIGMHFKGNCDQSQLRNNSFGVHNVGLYGDDFLLNLLQDDFGNTWLSSGNYTTYAAEYSGSNFPNAKFEAKSGLPYFPSSLTPALNWFFPTITTPGECVHLDPEGLSSEYQNWIQNYNNSEDFISVFEWNSLRNAHNALYENPQWLVGNPNLEEFYSENLNGDVGLLNEVRRGFIACTNPDEEMLSDLYVLIGQKKLTLSELYSVDTEINASVGPDSLLQAEKDELLQTLLIIEDEIEIIQNEIQSDFQSCCEDLLELNAEVVSNQSFVSLEKELNEIILEKYSEGRSANTPEEEERFTEIARLCYDFGGVNVDRAMFELADMQLIADLHDVSNCEETEERGSVKSNHIDFQIYPNPTSTSLNIKFQSELVQRVDIINSQGSYVLENLRANSIDVTAWPSGIYTIIVKSFENILKNYTFEVLH